MRLHGPKKDLGELANKWSYLSWKAENLELVHVDYNEKISCSQENMTLLGERIKKKKLEM